MTLKRTGDIVQVSGAGAVAEPTLRDVMAVNFGGEIHVYGLTDAAGDGLVHMQVSTSGVLTQVGNQFETGESAFRSYVFEDRNDPSGLAFAEVDGAQYVVTSVTYDDVIEDGPATGPTFFEIQSNGSLVSDGTFVRDGITQSVDAIVLGDGDSFMVEIEKAAGGADDTIVRSNISTLSFVSSSRVDLTSNIAYETHTVGLITSDELGQGEPDVPYAFFVDNQTNGIEFVSFPSSISAYNGSVEGSATSFANRPKDLEVLEVNGKTFLISSSEMGGIRAYDVVDSNFFEPVVALTDELDTNNGAAGFATDHIVTFNVGNRGFVAAAGERLVIYELGRDGEFFAMDKQSWTHGDIFDVDVAVRGQVASIVVAADNGIGTFQFTPDQAQNVTGSAGNDIISGDTRDNRFDGKAGNDKLSGAKGEDMLFGGADRDELIGGNSDDRLYGGNGRDVVKGGNGADRIEGGRGADTLQDGRGSDIMIGGGGVDTFVMTKDTARDTIQEWTRRDIIDVSVWGKSLDFEDLKVKRLSDGDLLVRYGRDSLEIDAKNALSVNTLNENDFIFA